MESSEVRTSFLTFFEEKGHTIYPSDLIYPKNDPSLLFTSAGMTQFKNMFLGVGRLPFSRAVTTQKCLRMPDIEKVGKTASHHTFFEMLGNFSFGDYFKQEAIAWAWELLTVRWGLREEQLIATIYTDDDEAYDIWRREIGLPDEKILRFGESENFWPANAPSQGPNGVCGPCSEIHYDYGADVGCGRPECSPACDCDRFVEIWNLVFTQFNRLDGGKLEPLPRKNIDTGLGFERACRLLQGKQSNFETDVFMPTIERLCDIAQIDYDEAGDNARRIRRVSDHMRSLCVAIADGVFPSNEGRGYVIRRLLRRAVSDGDYLGIEDAFLSRLVEPVVDTLGGTFPELAERSETIRRLLNVEEEKFRRTLDAGTAILDEWIEKLEAAGEKALDGAQAFKLYDTYGFPMEMTRDILDDRGLSMDEDAFKASMEAQREKARAASAIAGDIFKVGVLDEVVKKVPATEFLGYACTECNAEVVALATSEGERDSVDASAEGDVSLILYKTPFYGEAGGQVGDAGVIDAGGFEFAVHNTLRMNDVIVHVGRVISGSVSTGQTVAARVDAARRRDIAANHTGTHLLHWALRKVLGEDATQSGSFVSPERLRFDFAHNGQAPHEALARIERMVNEKVFEGLDVRAEEKKLAEARAEGVTALFGEKYGEDVRVVRIGEISSELCGGTHLASVADIGLFKIVSEEAIASGIRRITAVTRLAAYDAFREGDAAALETARFLGVKRDGVPERVAALQAEIKDLKKKLSRKAAAQASGAAAQTDTSQIGDVTVTVQQLDDGDIGTLRRLADEIVKGKKRTVGLLAAKSDKGVSLVVGATRDLVGEGLNAGEIAKRAAGVLGGGGGGRPNMGQAGGPNTDALDAAVAEARRAVAEALEG